MPSSSNPVSVASFATLAQAKIVRNVLNAPKVADFLNEINENSFGFLKGAEQLERQKALSTWMSTTARKWLLREGAAQLATSSDVKGAGSPEWAVEAQKEKAGLWMVKLTAQQRGQLSHMADWLLAEAPLRQLNKLSFSDALEKTVEWDAARERRAVKLGPDQPDDPSGLDELAQVKDVPGLEGGRWVRVRSAAALDREGSMMRHCVGSYAERVAEGDCEVYSLRDARNQPLATIEVRSMSAQTVQALAERENWSVERREAAAQLGAAREIVQARGPVNTALSELASASLGPLVEALNARAEAPIVAMAETGEGGLVPHPKRVGFVRWPQVEPGSVLPGRCVWSPEMGDLPEGLSFDVLELRQVTASTKLPASLKVKSLVINPSVKNLDARAWSVENVWVQRSGPFVKRSGTQLRFGRLHELAMEPPALQNNGQHLADELVDPTVAAPFAMIEAKTERALLGGLRSRELHLSEVKTLDLTGGWLERASSLQMETGASVNLTGLRAPQLSTTLPLATEGAALSWLNVEAAELPQANAFLQEQPLVPASTPQQDLDVARQMAHTQSLSATRWRPDQGRDTEVLFRGAEGTWVDWSELLDCAWKANVSMSKPLNTKEIEKVLAAIPFSQRDVDKKRERAQKRKMLTYRFEELKECDEIEQRHKDLTEFYRAALSNPVAMMWAQLADGKSKKDTLLQETTIENSDGVKMSAIGAHLGYGVFTPALVERLLSVNALVNVSEARKQWDAAQQKSRGDGAVGVAASWLSAQTLANAVDHDAAALSRMSITVTKKQEITPKKKPESQLDAKLPFSQDGVAIIAEEESQAGWKDKRSNRPDDMGVWAVKAGLLIKRWDSTAPVPTLLQEVIQALEMLPATKVGSRSVSSALLVGLEQDLSENTLRGLEDWLGGAPLKGLSGSKRETAVEELRIWNKESLCDILSNFYGPTVVHQLGGASALKQWMLKLGSQHGMDWETTAPKHEESSDLKRTAEPAHASQSVLVPCPAEALLRPPVHSTPNECILWAADILLSKALKTKKDAAAQVLREELEKVMHEQTRDGADQWLTDELVQGLLAAAQESRGEVFRAFDVQMRMMPGRWITLETLRTTVVNKAVEFLNGNNTINQSGYDAPQAVLNRLIEGVYGNVFLHKERAGPAR